MSGAHRGSEPIPMRGVGSTVSSPVRYGSEPSRKRMWCILGITEHFWWKDNPMFPYKTDFLVFKKFPPATWAPSVRLWYTLSITCASATSSGTVSGDGKRHLRRTNDETVLSKPRHLHEQWTSACYAAGEGEGCVLLERTHWTAEPSQGSHHSSQLVSYPACLSSVIHGDA